MTPTALEIALALALPAEAAAILSRIEGPGWECWAGICDPRPLVRGATAPASARESAWLPADPASILDEAVEVAGVDACSLACGRLGWTARAGDLVATGSTAREAALAVYAAAWREMGARG